MTDVLLLSNSEAADFRRCRRRWWLRWVRRLHRRREDITGARSRGNRVHRALAVYYDPAVYPDRGPADAQLDADLDADRTRALVADGGDPDGSESRELRKEGDLVRAMVDGYWQWLDEEGADQFIEVLASEKEHRVPLAAVDGVEVDLIEKLDAKVLNRNDGAVRQMDHKTTTAFGGLEPTAHINAQIRHYALVDKLQSEGTRGDGAILNMIRAVKRTAAAKPPFYKRLEVRHNDLALRAHFRRLVGQARDMIAARRALEAGADHLEVAYANPTKDCSWDCDFFPVCPFADEGGMLEAVLENMYEERDPLVGRYTEVV